MGAALFVVAILVGLVFITTGEAEYAIVPQDSPDRALGGSVEESQGYNGELPTVGGSALLASASPLGTIASASAAGGSPIGIITYTVKDGDTLSGIAETFGVSVNTILWENKLTSRSVIKPGMHLSILPIDGVKHTVARGDNLSEITERYKANLEEVLATNNLSKDEVLTIGDILIIPGGVPPSSSAPSSSRNVASAPTRSLVDISGYFIMPAHGRRTQGLHRYNAVDLGGSDFCNAPLYASADGVIISSQSSGWNGGYGKYIKISHPNGTVTLYAHNAQNLVSVGEAVKQGQVIALMGSTGNSTGCHVHFEVRGARNPFAS